MKIINWFKNNYILTIILFVAAILRFYHIDYQSIWLDEIHTINESNPKLSFSELYESLMKSDPHPPLYFMLVQLIFKIFGYTTFVLRMFSAILGVAGVYAIFLFGKEIFNKKVGLYASMLLTINYFHLFYSQEARMYSLLFLMTTFSFYFLVRFIKNPTIKSAFVYGVFSALMIYCHFFALFALISQYLILLFFILRPFNTSSKKFFYYCLIAGLTALILYLPTYNIFKKTAEITSIWIQMPTLDVYTQFFKDFFGQSELVLFFVVILFILFFSRLFKENNTENFKLDPNKDKLVFSFLVLFVWIVTTLILPLIRTYISLPMLINRYFINILPAIIIVVSIGLAFIRNAIVRYGILSIIVIFSLTDIIIVKKYYKTVNKTQFREVSQFIIDNNTDNEPVVTSLGWYFPFFLNNEKVKMTIIDKPLQDLVNEMILDSTKRKPFWYVDGHIRPINLTEPAQKYLDENFTIQNNIDLYDTWAKHYVRTSDVITTVDVSKFKPIKERNGAEINFTVETFEYTTELLNASGWAYFTGQDTKNSIIEIVLFKDGKVFKIQNQNVKRDDVSIYFKSQYDLSNSGFSSKALVKKLGAGKYQLGIIIKDKATGKEGFVLTDKFFNK